MLTCMCLPFLAPLISLVVHQAYLKGHHAKRKSTKRGDEEGSGSGSGDGDIDEELAEADEAPAQNGH